MSGSASTPAVAGMAVPFRSGPTNCRYSCCPSGIRPAATASRRPRQDPRRGGRRWRARWGTRSGTPALALPTPGRPGRAGMPAGVDPQAAVQRDVRCASASTMASTSALPVDRTHRALAIPRRDPDTMAVSRRRHRRHGRPASSPPDSPNCHCRPSIHAGSCTRAASPASKV